MTGQAVLRLLLIVFALAPLASVAKPAEEQHGHFSIPFACSASPVNVTLQDLGNGLAAAEADNDLQHNSSTILDLSDITIIGPNGANMPMFSAEVNVFGDKGKALGLLKGARGKGQQRAASNGLKRYLGTTRLVLRTSEPAFRAGHYQLVANLSCSQDL